MSGEAIIKKLTEDLIGGRLIHRVIGEPIIHEDGGIEIEVLADAGWEHDKAYLGPWLYLERLRRQERAEPIREDGSPDPRWAAYGQAVSVRELRVRLTRPGVVLVVRLGGTRTWG